MKLTKLRVNHIAEPMGYCMDHLSFSWTAEDVKEGKRQKWARVLVRRGTETVYDSGKRRDADSLDFPVHINLTPRTRYDWSVSVEADSGESASAVSFFETGKMGEPWIGKWITPARGLSEANKHGVCILEKEFYVRNAENARLYICGLGLYECRINGRKVGEEYLAPGYHSYDFHLQTNTYDVEEYLHPGKNKAEIWLGEGWFKGRIGFDGGYENLYGDKLYAAAELYAGGTLAAATDESWSCRRSPIIFSGIYDGEIYDARTACGSRRGMDITEGAAENETEDAEKNVPVNVEKPSGCGALCDRYSLPIVKKESFSPTEVLISPKGETILDFGQNITGWVEFECSLPEGTSVRLTAGEILQDGCFYRENYRLAKGEYIYISKGEKVHVRPHFTFYGFRYMLAQMKPAGGEWQSMNECGMEEYSFTAYHLRSDFDQIGQIVTGNRKVNQLFSNAMWGQKDNFLDVPTDCPQRDERLGWTGDAQIFSETACYNMYMPAFYRKFLWDMRAEQSITGGAVPNVVPRIKKGMISECGSCPWADAAVIIPWNVYCHYGSRTLLEECYPGMKAWVDYEREKEEKEGGAHLIGSGFHFADWLALDNETPGPFGATDPLYIASAYYYLNAEIAAEAAGILGYEEEAEEYGRLAREILLAVRDRYFDSSGNCLCPTQTASALAIMFGLSEKKEEEGKILSQRVADNGNHLNTGFVGTPVLCPALTCTGHHTQAMDLLLNEEYPGWLYAVNLGATTIWERWNSVLSDGHMNPEGMNSLNHYSYGSIEGWMYGYAAGIRAREPGFRKAEIRPYPDKRLGFLECCLETAAGVYESKWKYEEDGRISFEFTVPFHGAAKICLPDGREYEVEAGNYRYQM